MRRVLGVALVFVLSAVVSCSDMPTAPQPPPGNVTVEGVISDRDGPGLANAYVFFNPAVPPSNGFTVPYARTDLSGAYRVEMPGGVYEARIDPGFERGFPAVTIARFEAKKGGGRLDYRYSGTRVTGVVTGPGGSPLAGALVTAASPAIHLYVRADKGHYSMLIPPGSYDLYFDSGIYNSGVPSIEVEADIAATDTLLNVALTGHAVSVTVTSGGSTPLANVQVSAESDAIGARASAFSRVDGTAVLYLPSGGYSFTAYSPDRSIVGPQTGYWSISGDTSIPIDFPGTRWDITLRRTADDSAVPFASIYAIEIGSRRNASATTDLSGRFQLLVRPNQGYDLRVMSSDFGSTLATVPNVSSTADSTFDLFVDLPAP